MADEFVVKDSGKRQDFSTGSRRDTAEGKPCPDLISPFLLRRLGDHLAKGAKKYSRWNWAKGIPSSRYWESMHRHLMQYAMGDKVEDHLSAAVFNLMGIIHNEELKKLGYLPAELDDFPLDWATMMKPAAHAAMQFEGPFSATSVPQTVMQHAVAPHGPEEHTNG